MLILNRVDDDSPVITVTSVSLLNSKNCDIEDIAEFIIHTAPLLDTLDTPQATLKNSENTKIYNQCELFDFNSEKVIKCATTPLSLKKGKYSLSFISGSNIYDLVGLPEDALSLVDEWRPYDSTQGDIDIVLGEEFKISTKDADGNPLSIYLDEDKEIKNIRIDADGYYYKPSEEDIPTTGKYKIYYADACGELKETMKYLIEITSISVSDNSQCSYSEIASIELTALHPPTIAGAELIIKQSESEFTFSCNANDTPIVCSTNPPIALAGTYSLISITGADDFNFDSITDKTLTLETYPFASAEEQDLSPVISASSPDFTIKLSSATVTPPSVYIREKDNPCEVSGENLKCTPEGIESEGPHEVYYKNSCDEEKSTGISFTVELKRIKVTSFLINGTSKCAEEMLMLL